MSVPLASWSPACFTLALLLALAEPAQEPSASFDAAIPALIGLLRVPGAWGDAGSALHFEFKFHALSWDWLRVLG